MRSAAREIVTRPLIAALLTVAVATLVFTPLCGALFQCGCVGPWRAPWAELARHCNIHDPNAPAHCPWCVRPRIAQVSYWLATGAGVFASWYALRGRRVIAGRSPGSTPNSASPSAVVEIGLRTAVGLAAYVLVAALEAWILARAVGYPDFLGG